MTRVIRQVTLVACIGRRQVGTFLSIFSNRFLIICPQNSNWNLWIFQPTFFVFSICSEPFPLLLQWFRLRISVVVWSSGICYILRCVWVCAARLAGSCKTFPSGRTARGRSPFWTGSGRWFFGPPEWKNHAGFAHWRLSSSWPTSTSALQTSSFTVGAKSCAANDARTTLKPTLNVFVIWSFPTPKLLSQITAYKDARAGK